MAGEPISEPIRLSQRQTKITELLTGILPIDLERCVICEQHKGVGDHHLIFRSHGGEEGPTVPACQRCHANVHENKVWLLQAKAGEGLFVIDIATEEVIWRRLTWPLKVEPGEFVRVFDTARDVQKSIVQIAGALPAAHKAELFRSLSAVEEGGWRAKVRLVDEHLRYGTPGLTPGQKIDTVMDLFEISRPQAYNYKKIAETYRETDALERAELTQREFLTAADTTDPERWVNIAQERKLQDRNFTSDDLKEEAIIANEWKPDADGNVPEPRDRKGYGECPECGKTGYFKLLPIGSDGKPVE